MLHVNDSFQDKKQQLVQLTNNIEKANYYEGLVDFEKAQRVKEATDVILHPKRKDNKPIDWQKITKDERDLIHANVNLARNRNLSLKRGFIKVLRMQKGCELVVYKKMHDQLVRKMMSIDPTRKSGERYISLNNSTNLQAGSDNP